MNDSHSIQASNVWQAEAAVQKLHPDAQAVYALWSGKKIVVDVWNRRCDVPKKRPDARYEIAP